MFFKKKLELAKRTSVYISIKGKQILIAPLHINKAGILYEQENCKEISKSCIAFELGNEVMDSLNQFSLKDINLRDTKASDWPAFKKSKSKSVRAFEHEYIHISIDSCNQHNLVLEIKGYPSKESELTINSTISFYSHYEEIGKRIMNVYEVCLKREILSTGSNFK